MNFEHTPEHIHESPEYIKDLMKFKMMVEVQTMLILCGEEATEDEKRMWVETYSTPFRVAFDRRVGNDGQSFLEKCKTNSQDVAIEISTELQS